MPVKEAIRVEPSIYRMPKVQMGQSVNWYMDYSGHSKDANLAIVLRVSQRCVDLMMYREDGRVKFISDVRHVSDPSIPENDNYQRQGGWDHNADTKRLSDLEARIVALEELLTKK